jgi:hypothetical protein
MYVITTPEYSGWPRNRTTCMFLFFGWSYVGPWPYECGCGLGDVCHHHTRIQWMAEESDHLYVFLFFWMVLCWAMTVWIWVWIGLRMPPPHQNEVDVERTGPLICFKLNGSYVWTISHERPECKLTIVNKMIYLRGVFWERQPLLSRCTSVWTKVVDTCVGVARLLLPMYYGCWYMCWRSTTATTYVSMLSECMEYWSDDPQLMNTDWGYDRLVSQSEVAWIITIVRRIIVILFESTHWNSLSDPRGQNNNEND